MYIIDSSLFYPFVTKKLNMKKFLKTRNHQHAELQKQSKTIKLTKLKSSPKPLLLCNAKDDNQK